MHTPTISTNIPQRSSPEFLRYVVERSESLYPSEQALALASAAAALGNTDILKRSLLLGLEHGATPLDCYEALLQTYLFAGFPAALEAISMLHTVCKETNTPFHAPSKEQFHLETFTQRGETLCADIYTTAYSKMRTNLDALSPDLAEWMIVEGYGKTLARQGLTPRVRELCIVSVLAVTGWYNQLYSHLRGAMNVGAAPIECIDIVNNLEVFLEPHIEERVLAAKQVLERVLGRNNNDNGNDNAKS